MRLYRCACDPDNHCNRCQRAEQARSPLRDPDPMIARLHIRLLPLGRAEYCNTRCRPRTPWRRGRLVTKEMFSLRPCLWKPTDQVSATRRAIVVRFDMLEIRGSAIAIFSPTSPAIAKFDRAPRPPPSRAHLDRKNRGDWRTRVRPAMQLKHSFGHVLPLWSVQNSSPNQRHQA